MIGIALPKHRPILQPVLFHLPQPLWESTQTSWLATLEPLRAGSCLSLQLRSLSSLPCLYPCFAELLSIPNLSHASSHLRILQMLFSLFNFPGFQSSSSFEPATSFANASQNPRQRSSHLYPPLSGTALLLISTVQTALCCHDILLPVSPVGLLWEGSCLRHLGGPCAQHQAWPHSRCRVNQC